MEYIQMATESVEQRVDVLRATPVAPGRRRYTALAGGDRFRLVGPSEIAHPRCPGRL
jgi:hypothetical protein